CRPRLPLVGEQPSALMGDLKAKTKTLLRRKNQDHVGGSARLPLVGEQPSALIEDLKAKTKTLLRRKNQDHVGGSARLPLVGPERSKTHQKGSPIPAHLIAAFQAHPSMRIC
ncbi:MAG: hypothetical protein ABSC93_23160, partial [Bryobacteraceae bacterium]